MRSFLIVVTVITIFFSCSKEPILEIREGMSFDPDTLMVGSIDEGWELYTWQSGDLWKYSLMVKTERKKYSAEILSYDYAVIGREQLKLMLRQLPSGEEVKWYGTNWISENVEGVTTMYKMPSLLTQYDLHSFSERKSISIKIIP